MGVPPGGEASGEAVPPEQCHGPGWSGAAVETALVVAIGFALLVYLPNLVLTRSTWLTRSWRVSIAVGEFLVALGALAWALRRAQARSLGE